MDVATLRDRIKSTLDSNGDTRRQAELDLKYVCAGCWGMMFAELIANL